MSNQSVNMYGLTLPNSMSSISGLGVHSRVPIIVIKYDSVCCNQVYTKTTSSSRQNKCENIRICLILFDHEPTILKHSGTVHPEVRKLLPNQKVLKNVHHFCHLTENKAPTTFSMKSLKQFRHYFHFSAISYHPTIVRQLEKAWSLNLVICIQKSIIY